MRLLVLGASFGDVRVHLEQIRVVLTDVRDRRVVCNGGRVTVSIDRSITEGIVIVLEEINNLVVYGRW